MSYTIRTIPPPEMITVNGLNGPELRPAPDSWQRPLSYVRLIWTMNGVQCWEDTNGTATEAEYQPFIDAHEASYLPALLRAADAYQSEYISSVGIGILTIGVMTQKPKALAVMAWSRNLWAEYDRRRDVIMAGGAPDYDFTSCGPIPFTVWDLQEELGI